jgi:hypothetical protein
MNGLVSLLQNLCWARIWSRGLSPRRLGLQKAKRGRYAELFEYDAIEGRLYLPS